jgi:hypothetical protein
MAACVNHPTVPATAFCRTCGKPLCESCKKDVRGVVYCEDCLVAHLQNVMPPPPQPAPGVPYVDPATGYVRPPSTPNPTLAAFLGFVPGVGAFYNGQYQKGIVHVLIFPALIMLTNQNDIFGILIPFYFFYMAWDAYMTAKSRVTGEPVPDPLGINNLFGMEPKTNVTATAAPASTTAGVAGSADAANTPYTAAADASGAVPTAPKSGMAGVPMGAIILIGLGVLFLLGDISHQIINNFWPVILIVIGVWKGIAVWEVKQ